MKTGDHVCQKLELFHETKHFYSIEDPSITVCLAISKRSPPESESTNQLALLLPEQPDADNCLSFPHPYP